MELKNVLEAILFSAQKPLSPKELREVLNNAAKHAEEGEDAVKKLKKPKAVDIENALQQIADEHESAGRSYRLICIAGSWQFASQPEYHPWLRALLGEKPRPARLSQPALETLAIIAYRQPLTRSEMEDIRGVAVDGVVTTLVERGLAEKVGQAELPGRPALYGTTAVFLEYFGLGTLDDLPAADDLRRIPVQKPETLVTANPDLATQVDEQMSLEEVEGGKPAGEGNPEPETSNEEEQEETNAESTVVEDSAAEAAPDSEPPEIDDGEKDE
jgi:segregation and condensation protein B